MSMKLANVRAILSRQVICVALCAGLAGLSAQSVLGANVISPRYPTKQITREQWQVALDEVKAIPDVRCVDYVAYQYVCDSAARSTIWVFTKSGHPAFPAFTRGVMIVKQGEGGTIIGIDRSGHYAGDASAFDAWIDSFVALDKRQVAEWESKSH
jgi:hypothetical protein